VRRAGAGAAGYTAAARVRASVTGYRSGHDEGSGQRAGA